MNKSKSKNKSKSYPEGDMDSSRSAEDRLPMGSFLHTIPEGSSDLGAANASPFNPAAAAAAAASPLSAATTNNGNSSNSNSDASPWTAMMRPFRSSQQNARPAAPASVASSTQAVEAGNAGLEAPSSVLGQTGMDNSTRADAALGEDTEIADSETAPSRKKHARSTSMKKRKVGVVCFMAILLVLGVIIALIFIVRSLDEADSSDGQVSASNATGDAQSTGEALSPDNLETLVPTPEESLPSWATSSPGPTETEDFFLDDDDGTGDEEQSLLVKLDDVIYMLYTAEEAHLNMLPHVSAEVFSKGQSSRYQAREWLLNNDTLLQSTIMEMDSATDETLVLQRIAQRYIMLVFYFSTLDENSTSNVSSSSTTTSSSKIKDGQFAIDPDVHECFWIYNACGQEDDDTTNTNTEVAFSDTQVSALSATPSIQLDNEVIWYFNVSHSGLKGTLPFELGYLTGLRELTIHGNELTGSIPELLLTDLQFLYVLDLSYNSFQGTIPSALWTLPILRFAYLHGNRFTGTIPEILPELPSTALEEIWLRDNRLSGSIPQWWTELPNLDVLYVSNNTWTGQLPKEWSGASNLEHMDLSYNQLTGTIPPSLLYSVPSLQNLYLDYNQLGGTLPTRSSALDDLDFTVTLSRNDSRMKALWLQYNQLTGTIPNGFGEEFTRLRQLELQGNRFVGTWECVEEGKDQWPQLEELAIDCLSGPSLDSEQNANVAVQGVDMRLCNVCCLKCF